MVVSLTADDIRLIHSIVEEQFPSVVGGIKDNGLIESIAERPNQRLFGIMEPFDDVFSKAACLMESIARWHPFIDGNKRTGLLAAFSFLYRNGYYLVIPLSAVKFTVKIADTQGLDQETTVRLIKEISSWLQKRSARNANEFFGLIIVYHILSVSFLIFLDRLGFHKYANRKVADWFAIESHPEYVKEIEDVARFLGSVMRDALNDLRSKREMEKTRKSSKK